MFILRCDQWDILINSIRILEASVELIKIELGAKQRVQREDNPHCDIAITSGCLTSIADVFQQSRPIQIPEVCHPLHQLAAQVHLLMVALVVRLAQMGIISEIEKTYCQEMIS